MPTLDQPQKHSEVEVSKRELALGNTNRGSKLYDIVEIEGTFEVVLPGLLSPEREWIVGTRRERFATREEAEQGVTASRIKNRILFESASLQKSCDGYFYRIDVTDEGTYRVVLPGLVDSTNGYFVGTTEREFDSWDEAKQYFLNGLEQEEMLSKRPILEVKTGESETIAFSQLDAFHPRVAPAELSRAIPDSIRTYLMREGRLDGSDPSASTYQETIKEKDWEQKLFFFISSYLENDGAEILTELKIKRLDALTPKQAIHLTTRIVMNLTKYKWSDVKAARSDTAHEGQESEADRKTVRQLLQEGLIHKNDPEWEGNGVCRNFASAAKAVFEALKARQTRFSRLRNTYALYESGMDQYNPRRQNWNVPEMGRSGHAWNTFVTISRSGAANATIIDVTWATRDLDTQEIEGLDHTLLRMEPVVHAVGKNLSAETPNREEQVQHLLSYYVLKIEGLNQDMPELPSETALDEERVDYKKIAIAYVVKNYDVTSLSNEQIIALAKEYLAKIRRKQEAERLKRFFVTRVVSLIMRQGVPKDISPVLTRAISEEYQHIGSDADKSEIEAIYKISQVTSNMDFEAILRCYLKEKQLSDYHADPILFLDPTLQMLVFSQIKSQGKFDQLMKESPKIRIRMREISPELFPNFSPGTKREDAAELRYLAGQSHLLSRYVFEIDPRAPSEKRIADFFVKARQLLRAINPGKYDEIAETLDDYQLIRQYNRLCNEFRS